jgi:integrase
MPAGAAIIRREGKRGVTWSLKFLDATGAQVWERLGREPEWNEKRAQRELGVRLERVERERWRKPTGITFAEFAERFRREYLPGRNLKKSSQVAYRVDLNNHLLPTFGPMLMDAIEPEHVDRFIADKLASGLSPKTVSNLLGTLRVVFKVAQRWRVVQVNPVLLVEPPRQETPEMNVLDEDEIARLLAAYRELEAEADEPERVWWRNTRRIVTLALATGLRRGELLGLRWRAVKLLDGLLTVESAFVRGEFTSPKSRASRRTLDLGPQAVAVLEEQFAEAIYKSDDDLVFCHPHLGTALDASKLSRDYMRPALKRAGIVKPFRVWHDLRHTSLTAAAAAGNPPAYVQMRAGHSQGSITERYVHAAQVLFPGAAERAEGRLFGSEAGSKTGSN